MSKPTIFLLLFFSWAQSQTEPAPNRSVTGNLNLDITGFSYPFFFSQEQHASFLIRYPMTQEFEAELQGFYDTYMLSNRFRTAMTFKYYLSKRWYVFSGVEAEIANNKGVSTPLPPSIGAVMGFGYDVNRNFSMEGKYNYQLNNSPMGAFGESLVPMPKIYTIGGKFKF